MRCRFEQGAGWMGRILGSAAGRWLRLGGFGVLLAWVLAGGGAGCQVARETASLPVEMVSAVMPGGGRSARPDPGVLQVQVMRYADDFSSRTAAALDEYLRLVEGAEARQEALSWKLTLSSSALSIATGPNPTANLLDFVALATLTREYLQSRASRARPAGALDAWLGTGRQLETNAWELARGALTAEQVEELQAAIRRWSDQNTLDNATLFERPQEFSAVIRQSADNRQRPGSLFGVVGLDPTASLDPAVREVTRTRLFAERALYAVERLPFLVRWQTELLAERFLAQQEVAGALRSADRLSRAAESASATAAELPDRLSAERRAILEALESHEGRLRELSAEVGRTLAAGEKMSASLDTTLRTFDALMKRFGVGEPPAGGAGMQGAGVSNGTNGTGGTDRTKARPFDVLDYARTAEQITAMARELDALIRDATGTLEAPALDRRIAELNALSARARADATSVVNHAFLLAAGLVVLGFAGAVVYRRTGRPPAPRP